jgi:Domain of unknown function (DUF4249)
MKNLLLLILLIIGTLSCISPYEFSLNDNPEFLLIEGKIYQYDSCFVKVAYTNQKSNEPVNNSITDAKVALLENGKTIIPFVYDKVTEKYKPQNLFFRGCVDCTYKLNILLPSGKEFESTTDTIKTPDIYERIADTYNPTKKKFEVFGELKSKGQNAHYYQTYFINYVRASYCAECEGGFFGYEVQPNLPCPGRYKSCKPRDSSTEYNPNYSPYLFPCDIARNESYNCWNFKRQRYYSIFSDEILPFGSPRIQRLVEIPLSSYIRYYIEVYQNHLTTEAYKYLKLLEENGRRNGTLVDPVPPAIFGNIYLRGDENKRTLGYFQVSGQRKYGYAVERGRIQGGDLLPVDLDLEYYNLFNGNRRPVVVEPLPNSGCKFPPYADCVPNAERTNVRPLNWRD